MLFLTKGGKNAVRMVERSLKFVVFPTILSRVFEVSELNSKTRSYLCTTCFNEMKLSCMLLACPPSLPPLLSRTYTR